MKGLKLFVCTFTFCATFVATMGSTLFGDTAATPYQLPPNAHVIVYLLESVTWYRHLYAERQVATDTSDLLFLNNNQVTAGEIVKLSFEFAKADASLAVAPSSLHQAPMTPARNDVVLSDLPHFVDLKNRAAQATQTTTKEIDILKQRIAVAPKAARRRLRDNLDDAQSRLELLQQVSQTVGGLTDFIQRVGTDQAHSGDLNAAIDDLEHSIPDIANPQNPSAMSHLEDASSGGVAGGPATGILGLASKVSALNRKLRVVDEKLRLTDDLASHSKTLRNPMAGFITRLLQGAPLGDVQTSELPALQQQKSQLDALTLELKNLSPAILALDKQKVLLAEYRSQLLSWRAMVADQYRQAWEKLALRLLIVTLTIALLIAMTELSRRVAFRRAQDPNRRRAIGMIHTVVMLFAIAVVALFGFASDLRSVATYFGLLTAGVAVALQSVIVATLGYLILVGKRGIRIGDRVQVSGISGDVIDIGLLQFQLREFDVQKQRFTGHVATFSNSLVFVTPAVGLLKLDTRVATQDASASGAAGASASHTLP